MAVAVINYNTVDHLRTCLASVRATGAREVLVKDNGSTDGSVEMVRREFPEVAVHPDFGNPGYGAAANQAVAACRAPYVFLLNSDTILQPDTLRILAAHLDAHPDAGIVGPRLHNPDGTLQNSARPFFRPITLRPLVRLVPGWRDRSILTWTHDHDRAVPWVVGAALAIRRRAFEAVGGFDPAYFMYSEEVDLCYRLRAAGWTVRFTPATTVVHVGGASTTQRRAAMQVQLYASMRQFYARHYPPGRLTQLDLVLKGQMVVHLLRDRARLALAHDGPDAARLRENIQIWRRVLRGEWPERRGAARPTGAA
ncbi:MAG TPA: glycosyltransferase family 2 protein [Gemmatimonadales bacterium]|nr:glycosyltransferase family 2 protein [Gemmatimonadales bacterium]